MIYVVVALALIVYVAVCIAVWAGYQLWIRRSEAADDLAPGVKPYWKRQRS